MVRQNRREFMEGVVYSGVALGTSTKAQVPESSLLPGPREYPEVCTFTESFQDLPIPEVCRVFKEIGLDGLDLTVRPGGHIEPEDVEEKLPEADAAARKAGVSIMMLTTGITEPDRNAERILSTCSQLGVRKIKLGYHHYENFGRLRQEMDRVRRHIERVSDLARRFDVLPCVHVHAGPVIPSDGLMLYELIREMPPDRVGAYLDSTHMTLEGAADGWRQAVDLLSPWIALVALKNFWWERLERDVTGQQRWRYRFCPLTDGVAPIPDFISSIHATGYRGFYTLHSEYKSVNSYRKLSTDECIEQTRADFAFLKRIFDQI